MSRTRIVFFVVLALFLGLIAIALAIEVFSPQAARQLFISATVFSVGVVLLDFLGVLGGHHGDASQDGDGGLGLDHAAGTTHDTLPLDHAPGHAPLDGDHPATVHDGHQDAGHATHANTAAAPILSVLTYLRLMVYFCLGFGPTGWVALARGWSALTSLAVAAPVGFGALFLAQAFFRFQRRDTDSQVQREDLLREPATVIVPLDGRTMGKVRVRIGMNVIDRYALADEPDARFRKGDTVRISRITDECVYVR